MAQTKRKTEPAYFDLTNSRKYKLPLPSGGVARFYRGRPELNPITDERDKIECRKHPFLKEVMKVTIGKDKEQRWVDVKTAERHINRRVGTIKEVQQVAEGGKPQPVSSGQELDPDRNPTVPEPVATPGRIKAKVAQPKLRAKAAAPAKTEETPQKPADDLPLDDRISQVILTKLDPKNEQHYTKGGVPRVEAIETFMPKGTEITADDRNRVWAQISPKEE